MTQTLNQTSEVLSSYKEAFEAELQALLDEVQDSEKLKTEKFFGKDLIDSIKYSIENGGKRLRPILSLLSAQAVLHSKTNPDQFKQETQSSLTNNPALGLALAIELIHCGSLIHDDLPCMDNDKLRRGLPTNHIKFGEANALLAGDFLMVYPIEILIRKTPKPTEAEGVQHGERLSQAVLKLSQAIQEMIYGQFLDMNLNKIDFEDEKSRKELISKMQKLKTGALLKASIEIAAILSSADKSQAQALKSYAEKLGLAFQITDDVLDCTSSTEELGKTAGKDKAQGKLTFVQEHGLEQAKELAIKLVSEAIEEIQSTDLYTDKLELIAKYVISRTN